MRRVAGMVIRETHNNPTLRPDIALKAADQHSLTLYRMPMPLHKIGLTLLFYKGYLPYDGGSSILPTPDTVFKIKPVRRYAKPTRWISKQWCK